MKCIHPNPHSRLCGVNSECVLWICAYTFWIYVLHEFMCYMNMRTHILNLLRTVGRVDLSGYMKRVWMGIWTSLWMSIWMGMNENTKRAYEWVNEWVFEWMHETYVNESMNESMNEYMNEYMNENMNEYMNECMNEYLSGCTTRIWMDAWNTYEGIMTE